MLTEDQKEKLLKAPEPEFLEAVLLGDKAAIAFCQNLFWVAQKFDDLIDRDRPVSNEEIIKLIWLTMVAIPGNDFYRSYLSHLHPIIRKATIDYRDSTAMEHNPTLEGTARELAHSVFTILIDVAYLVGGYHHGEEVSLLIRQRLNSDSDSDFEGDSKCPKVPV